MSALMVEALATSKEDLGRLHDRREVGFAHINSDMNGKRCTFGERFKDKYSFTTLETSVSIACACSSVFQNVLLQVYFFL